MKSNTWEIVRRDDGTFELFHKGKLLKTSIPEKWLEDTLADYGFCGQEYRDILRQLELHGKAEMAL